MAFSLNHTAGVERLLSRKGTTGDLKINLLAECIRRTCLYRYQVSYCVVLEFSTSNIQATPANRNLNTLDTPVPSFPNIAETGQKKKNLDPAITAVWGFRFVDTEGFDRRLTRNRRIPLMTTVKKTQLLPWKKKCLIKWAITISLSSFKHCDPLEKVSYLVSFPSFLFWI